MKLLMFTHSIYSRINLLPPNKIGELLDFIEFLLNKEFVNKDVQPTRKKPKFGCAKGKFILSADFDEPLADFNEYMP